MRDLFNKTPSLLWLLFPLLVVATIGIFIIAPYEFFFKELAAFVLMTMANIAMVALFSEIRIRNAILLLSYFLLAFFAFVKLSFYLQYGVGISASALYVIFETNKAEASDFMSNYLNLPAIGMAILLLAPIFFVLRKPLRIQKPSSNRNRLSKFVRSAVLLAIIFASLFLIRKRFATQNIPYATLTTWSEYKQAKQQLKDELAQPLSPAFSEVASDSSALTLVVVLGESTSRWHMQLYGYERETNPKLTSIKEELVVMDSVITPHVHTITALDKILTLADTQTPSPEPNGSIIQLANQAGFTTYWISNQKPVGLYESIPTIIGSAAQHTKFLATDDYNHIIYDETVLPELEKVLSDSTVTKKLVFIHLIGSHLRYEKRYPASFDFFTEPSASLKYDHTKAIAVTNAYDNSVRYNDHVLYRMIELLRKETSPTAMTYFSDHGDEVYDTFDFVGHNEYHATRPMYEVPMLFWFSDNYVKKNSQAIKNLQQRRYSLEHFPHTFADLAGIAFKGLDKSKSVLDSSFVTRKRIIKGSIDYDHRE